MRLQQPYLWPLGGGPWPVAASWAGTDSPPGVGVQLGPSKGLRSLCGWRALCPRVRARPSFVSTPTQGMRVRRLPEEDALGPQPGPSAADRG